MERSFVRKTLKDSVSLEGRGLHSGVPVQLSIHPGEQGIAFRRGETRVPATPDQVQDTRRCTCLGGFRTIEHVMSALAGLGITDAEVELTADECPAMDGSSAPLVALLQEVGSVQCGLLTVSGPFARVYDKGDHHSVAMGTGEGIWRYEFVAPEGRFPGMQEFEITLDADAYAREIAWARTFAFEEEVEPLRAAGLGQGLDETSVLVLGPCGFINEARKADEPVRHKLLDLIGDLALAGVPVMALSVVAEKSGHTANVAAAAKLAAAVKVSRSA